MHTLLRRLFHRSLSRDGFAKRVLREFRNAGAENLHYNESEFSITVGGGGNRAFLENVYSNCRDADEESRQASINHLVATFLHTPSVPNSFELASPHLLPVIRHPAYNSPFRLRLFL